MLKIYDNTKIYVLAPGGVQTGGPEALHQLVDRINLLGLKGYIVYVDVNVLNASSNWISCIKHMDPLSTYKNYRIMQATSIEDNAHNIIITPEIWPNFLNSFINIQKAIWWLAIPNYEVNISYDVNLINHFYQSDYAKNALMANNLTHLYPLSDYTNKTYFVRQIVPKEDIVLYNPKKGINFTKAIIESDPSIQYVPVENMTPAEIKALMERAKVYIDFGHHPGKDRIPREAAITGCCVLVGKMGSAQYFRDIPIPEDYKFDMNNFNPFAIVNKIKECFKNFDETTDDFQMYRKSILMEERIFDNEVRNIFCNESQI